MKALKLTTLKRKASKAAKANGHSIKWGNVFGNATSNRYSQVGVCKHCAAGVACHEGIGIVHTRGLNGEKTMRLKCADVVAEIEKDMAVYKE